MELHQIRSWSASAAAGGRARVRNLKPRHLAVAGGATAATTAVTSLFVGSASLWIGVVAIAGIVALGAPVAWVAVIWASLLPIDVVNGVPGDVLDALRYVGAAVLVARLTADSDRRGTRLPRWIVLLALLGIARLAAAGLRMEPEGVRVAATMLVGLLLAALVVTRAGIRPHLLGGFVAGASASAFVVVLQVLELPTVRDGRPDAMRYPGLSSQTTSLTWVMAFAVVIAATTAMAAGSPRTRWAAWAAVALCGWAMVACGAQGGVLGVVGAAVVVVPGAARSLTRRGRRAALLGAVALLAAILASVMLLELDGFPPEKGYVNETARWDVGLDGIEEIARHPVLGMDRADFHGRYGALPHLMAIEAGVAAGVVGLVLGLAITFEAARLAVRGFGTSDMPALTGFAVVTVAFANTFVEAGGFIGLGRTTVVLLGVVLCSAPMLVSQADAGSSRSRR